MKAYLVGMWAALVAYSPHIMATLSVVVACARVQGYHGPSYQAAAHMLVACLFTLGVCREKPTSKLYTFLAVWLTVVELLAFVKLI